MAVEPGDLFRSSAPYQYKARFCQISNLFVLSDTKLTVSGKYATFLIWKQAVYMFGYRTLYKWRREENMSISTCYSIVGGENDFWNFEIDVDILKIDSDKYRLVVWIHPWKLSRILGQFQKSTSTINTMSGIELLIKYSAYSMTVLNRLHMV